MRKIVSISLLLFVLIGAVFLAGCGDSGGAGGSGGSGGSGDSGGGNGSGKHYKAPAFKDSAFHENKAQGQGGVLLDLSQASKGYVALSVESDSRIKFQICKGKDTYTYDVSSDGTPSILPLQLGNGTYTFKVMKNISGSKYTQEYTASEDVKVKNKFMPFLRPSDYSDYSRKSECVQKAKEIADKSETSMDVVSEIFDYICDNVTYDKEKAETVQSGYLPDPDETLSTGKGICFDYASLAAAMLRSQGIPTKIVFGYVSPDGLYHAWNMFYTKETGWVTVDYEVEENSWNRIDTTFSSNGTDDEFIGDGSNYTDVYFY